MSLWPRYGMGMIATTDRTYFITLRLKFPDGAFLKDPTAPLNKTGIRSPLGFG